MKKLMAFALALILTATTFPAYALAEDVQNPNATLEEKVAALKVINGGDYSASSEPMTMTELMDMLINAYKLDEQYVKAMGDGNADDPASYDNAFLDFGGGGDPNMPFMRGNLAYVITKLYGLSGIPIDNPESWQHMGQTGYSEIDGVERGYPGNKEAVYICQQLGIDIPQVSDTELGFETPVTKAEFAIACYSAIGKEPFSFVPDEVIPDEITDATDVIAPVEIVTETVSNDYYSLTNVICVLEEWDGSPTPPAGQVRPVNGGVTYAVTEGAKLTDVARLFRQNIYTHANITWDKDAIHTGEELNSVAVDEQQLNVKSIDLKVNTRYRFDVEYDYGWKNVWEYTINIFVVDNETAAKLLSSPPTKPALPPINPVTTPTPATSALTATPTPSTVFVNGEIIAFDAYHIEGSNYFKLRDIAFVMNGTNKPFNLGYDNATAAITLLPGQLYVPAGGEMVAGDGQAKTATPTASKIYLNDGKLSLTVYSIGGNNFFKLVDLMSVLNVGVTYNATTGSISIDTNASFTGVVTVSE